MWLIGKCSIIFNYKDGSSNWGDTDCYSMTAQYDKDGNIEHLQRYGATHYMVINVVNESCEPLMVYPTAYGLMDDLSYTYNTDNNTLQTVTDAVAQIPNGNDFNGDVNNQAHYSYLNGSLTGDSGKGMSINKYNFLEHPEIISTDEGRIELTYDALGNKLQKRVYAEGFNPDNYPNSCATEALMNQQDYLLDFLYRWYYPETDDNGAPKFRAHRFYHEEGSIEWRRVDASNGNSQTAWEPTYQYTIRDHLGNGRVYFTKDYNGDGLPDILQASHYYPFGQQIEGLSKLYDPPGDVFFSQNGYLYPEDPATGNTTFIEYRQYTHDLKRYNGKEYNRELGLNWYDYGARWYDPVIGRWNAVDPLAEDYYSWSPFHYVYNNPLIFIDPNGKNAEGVIKDDGKLYINATYYAVSEGKGSFTKEQISEIQSILNSFWVGAKGMNVEIEGQNYEIGGVSINVEEGGNFSDADSKTQENSISGNILLKTPDSYIKKITTDNTLAASQANHEGQIYFTHLNKEEVDKFRAGDGNRNFRNQVIDESGHILGTRHPKDKVPKDLKMKRSEYRAQFGRLERGKVGNGTLDLGPRDLQNIVNSKEFTCTNCK